MKTTGIGEASESHTEDFYSRWSERKQGSRTPLVENLDEEALASSTETEASPLPGDEDMPPLEGLDEKSDYAGFLSPKVSDGLRRLALRKLFHSADFNICDGLDDYAEDFRVFEKLGDIITSDMRHQLEEARRKLDKLSDQDADQSSDSLQAESDASEGSDEQPSSPLQTPAESETAGHSANKLAEYEGDEYLDDELGT